MERRPVTYRRTDASDDGGDISLLNGDTVAVVDKVDSAVLGIGCPS